MFGKVKLVVANFFNRIPPVVLIPTVMLMALGIAVFLIWAGIKLSPVVMKENGVFGEEGKRGKGRENDVLTGSTDSSLAEEDKFCSEGGGFYGACSSLNLETGGDVATGATGANSEAEGNGQPGQSNQGTVSNTTSDSLSSGNEEEGATSAQTNSSYYGNIRNSNKSISGSGSASKKCAYPAGDVNLWWHNATPRQKNCYISQHGQPDLSSKAPYFCGYEDSKDCYYKK